MAEAERIIGTPDVEGAGPEKSSENEGAGETAAVKKDEAEGAETAAEGGASVAAQVKRKLPLLLIVALIAYALDLGSKLLVVAKLEPSGETINVIGELLQFRAIRNAGAAFGIGEAYTIVFTIIASSVIIVIARLARKLYSLPWAIALGLLLGGALGNLTDRIFRTPGFLEGAVVDFIAPAHFAVFNLADSAVVCGGILIVILSFKGLDPDGTVHKS
ncbi:lipoprotein signal peptidase [Streptomyces spiroverticillatus]|uniref:Lipoprotein signal peptidase n=1 Tax=Streptomyces finlayi TaxID=67296 RepID=A0A918WXG2_9ACTN|nr:signal peptidase II [Streptomyces finlayi]GGZ93081.1 lipoprotein signal peptidase [Streptomyces spiroverticillatus]GHC92556.1 lipoprotein signal peptidase [Streptomyces finlayi]